MGGEGGEPPCCSLLYSTPPRTECCGAFVPALMGCGHTKATRPGVEGTGGGTDQGGATSQRPPPHTPSVPLPGRRLSPPFASTLCIPPCLPTSTLRPYICLLSAPPFQSLHPPSPPLHSFLMPHFTDSLPIPSNPHCRPIAHPPLCRHIAPNLADALHVPHPASSPPPPSPCRWKCRSEQPQSILRPHRVPPPPCTPHLIAEDAIGLGAARGHSWAGGGAGLPPGLGARGGRSRSAPRSAHIGSTISGAGTDPAQGREGAGEGGRARWGGIGGTLGGQLTASLLPPA